MSSYFITLPRTEAAKELENLEEVEKQFQFVYRIAENGETAELVGLYDETPLPDDADYLILPFSSSFIKNADIMADEEFVNVIGSSKDRPAAPYNGLSWIIFYDTVTQQTGATRINNCVTDGRFYSAQGLVQKYCDSSYCPYCGNRKNLIGGHVIVYPKNEVAIEPSKLPGAIVGILPICMEHNQFNNGKMKARQITRIPLINYTLSKEDYQEELDAANNQIISEKDRFD